jgi:DHA1 family bicyclomycin/chloramphenicol resistance-like MFS transporter
MNKIIDQPIIKTKPDNYIILVMIIAPLLNFLSGINIDMYVPSMPSIANHFAVSVMLTKNTVSITILGMVIGCVIFGALIDSIGRKSILSIGVFCYMLASFIAPWAHTMTVLMLIRFMQGVMIATVTIGCRALVIDNITGKRYAIAILYTSIAYGSGPIIGPFIGGVIQYNFGWQANFIALGIIGGILLLLLVLFIQESSPERQSLQLPAIVKNYFSVLRHKQFMAGVIILGLAQIELMLYPTLGPFIVENILHYNVLVYGNTALIVGAGYLIGALINRFLLHYFSPKEICYFGYIGLVLALIISYVVSVSFKFKLLAVIIPLLLICISVGFIFPNIMGTNLKQFSKNAGVAMATQTTLLALVATLGIFIINYFHINQLVNLAVIYTTLIFLQLTMFFFIYKKIFKKEQ